MVPFLKIWASGEFDEMVANYGNKRLLDKVQKKNLIDD